MSIQHINTKKKPNLTTLSPSQAVLSYKESKLKANIHALKNKTNKIHHEDLILNTKITQNQKAYEKNSKNISLSRPTSHSSLRSSRSGRSIEDENMRIFIKINNTTSIYSKIRKERSSRATKQTNKQAIINLLVNQLGVKPSVLFPNIDKKTVQ